MTKKLSRCTLHAARFLLLALLAGHWSLAAATTVSGTIKKPDGTLVNGTIEFVLSQAARTTSPPVMFAPMKTTCTVTNGAIAGTCTVQGNDTLDPAGTYYKVRVVDTNKVVVFPQTSYTISGASVDLGTLAITASETLQPPAGSVTGNQNVTGNLTVGGTVSFSGSLPQNFSQIRYLGNTSDPGGVVLGSSWYRSDTDQLRFRVGAVQTFDGANYNSLASLGAANTWTALQSFTKTSTATVGANGTVNVLTGTLNADAGGKFQTGDKSSFDLFSLTHNGRTKGEHIGYVAFVNGYGIGDAAPIGSGVKCWGGRFTSGGTSQPQCYALGEFDARAGDKVFRASSNDSALNAPTIIYASDTNESVLGERQVYNLTSTYAVGTVSGIAGAVVTGSGTTWLGLSTPRCFKIDADDVTIDTVSVGHWYRVNSIDSNTQITLETSFDANLTQSGAYTLARCAEITAFDTTANTITIETNTHDFAALDSLQSPPNHLYAFKGASFIFDMPWKSRGQASWGLSMQNSGPFLYEHGLRFIGSGTGGFDTLISAASTNSGIGIDFNDSNFSVAGLRFNYADAIGDSIVWGTGAGSGSINYVSGILTLGNNVKVTSSDPAVGALVAKQQASPTGDFFRLERSTAATVLKVTSGEFLQMRPNDGTGIELGPLLTGGEAGNTVHLAAIGGNTNIALALKSRGTSAVRINAVASTGTGGLLVGDGTGNDFGPIDAGLYRIRKGISTLSTGFQHLRVTTGSITAGARADVTVTWTTAFADANYTPNCTVLDTSAAGTGLRVERIRSQAAASIVVQVMNDAAAARTGTLNCTAVHD